MSNSFQIRCKQLIDSRLTDEIHTKSPAILFEIQWKRRKPAADHDENRIMNGCFVCPLPTHLNILSILCKQKTCLSSATEKCAHSAHLLFRWHSNVGLYQRFHELYIWKRQNAMPHSHHGTKSIYQNRKMNMSIVIVFFCVFA